MPNFFQKFLKSVFECCLSSSKITTLSVLGKFHGGDKKRLCITNLLSCRLYPFTATWFVDMSLSGEKVFWFIVPFQSLDNMWQHPWTQRHFHRVYASPLSAVTVIKRHIGTKGPSCCGNYLIQTLSLEYELKFSTVHVFPGIWNSKFQRRLFLQRMSLYYASKKHRKAVSFLLIIFENGIGFCIFSYPQVWTPPLPTLLVHKKESGLFNSVKLHF